MKLLAALRELVRVRLALALYRAANRIDMPPVEDEPEALASRHHQLAANLRELAAGLSSPPKD